MARPVDAVMAQARAFLGDRMTTNAALREQRSHGGDTNHRPAPAAARRGGRPFAAGRPAVAVSLLGPALDAS